MLSPYRLVGACLAPWLLTFLTASPVRAWDDVVWSAGGSDPLWSTPENWSSLAPPGADDRVIFTDAGALTTIGETTSVLAEDWEIAALSIQNGVRVHHTIDLGGHSLSISDRLDVNDFTRGVTTTTIKNGRLTLGSSDRPAELSIGSGDESAWIDLDLTGIHFDAHLSHVAIGDMASNVERMATLLGGASGSFVVGSPSAPGTFVVGRSVGPGSEFTFARLDLREQDTFAAYVDEFLVGVNANSLDVAFVYGGKTANLIQANAVRIGANGLTFSGHGQLFLSGQSVIRTPILEVGVNSSGDFFAENLELGTPDAPVRVMVGNRSDHSLLGSTSGYFWVGGTTNAYLQELLVGVQENSTESFSAGYSSFDAGAYGHIQVGTAESPSNLVVARNASADATLNPYGSLSAHVDRFWIGTSDSSETTWSTVELARTTEIFANSMRIGYHEYDDTLFGSSRATVTLNGNTTLRTDELLIGINATGRINTFWSSAVELGTAAQPTRLVMGHASGSQSASGDISLSSNAKFDAVLSELVMGEAVESGSGRTSAALTGGNQGSVTIGSPDTRGQLIIAKSAGAASAEAEFNVSGLDRFVAYLDRFEAGLGAQSSISSTLGLARDSLIDVPEMHIGKSSRDLFTPQASITLGLRNTIRTDRIILGVGTINATIQGRVDSELQLGEPTRRVDVAIASGELGATTRKFTSALDLSRTATIAWLGDVSVGDGHADNPLALTGRLAFGPNSHIDARSITLAQGNATGILELTGGELLVERIARGAGAAQFKWTGGTLEVGEFGDDDFAFHLANLGQGILGIPNVSGLATVHGDYSQGPQATLEVHGRAAGFEQLSVTGNATLSGTLKLRLEPGFHPVVGETFLLVAAASVGGTFDRVTGFLAGDTFLHPLYSASSIELRAYRAGDGNLDGAVDGADYTRWSDHYLTTTHQGIAAGDYNGDGLVDGADYTLWADHFTAAPSPTLATHAVPEPSSLLLALLGIVLGAAVSRGRAKF